MAFDACDEAVEFARLLTEKFGDEHSEYTVTAGRNFDQIVRVDRGSQYSHAFVCRKTGQVLKSNGWKQPFRSRRRDENGREYTTRPLDHVRYLNIHDAADAADRFGSYLYEQAATKYYESVAEAAAAS